MTDLEGNEQVLKFYSEEEQVSFYREQENNLRLTECPQLIVMTKAVP